MVLRFQKIIATIQISNFREFKSSKDIHYTEHLKENEYNRNYKLQGISHIPFTAKIRKFPFRDTYLQIRETGVITLIVYYIKKEGENPLTIIKSIKSSLRGNILKIIIDELLSKIDKTDENKHIDKLGLRFNPPVTTIFQFLGKDKKRDEDQYREELVRIGNYLGNEKLSHRKHLNDYRMVSKSFNAFLSFDETISKKGRRMLREGILQSIHLAHALFMIYDKLSVQSEFNLKLEGWRVFLNYYNPYVLADNEFTNAIIGTALKQTWFNEISRLFQLKSKIRSLLLNIIREGKLDIYETFVFTHALRMLPYKTIPAIVFPTLKTPPGRLSELEVNIIEQLYERHRDEIEIDNDSQNSKSIEIKHGIGLTTYKLTINIMLVDNQNTRKLVRDALYNLIDKQFVGYTPYKGPGSRSDSKSYFLNYRLIDFTDQLIRYIGEKFP